MNQPEFEIFVDAGCPLCSREARWLERLDRGRGRLKITAIGSGAFARSAPGLSFDRAMRSIHGKGVNGRIIHGVEVFRRAYSAVGLGWLWAPTRLPFFRQLTDLIYGVFAVMRYRHRSKAMCSLATAPVESIVE